MRGEERNYYNPEWTKIGILNRMKRKKKLWSPVFLTINEAFLLANQLTKQLFKIDPLTKKMLSFKKEIQELLMPYENVCKRHEE